MAWKVSPPLLAPASRPADPCYSVKDPSVVYYDNRWHVFCTIRSEKRSHQIEYISFDDWKKTADAERRILKISDRYFCAPQVFYLTPHHKWYMVYQAAVDTVNGMVPAYSTNSSIDKPDAWTKPIALIDHKPEHVPAWIDFWIICDQTRAHLFFTSLNGMMWRCQTKLDDFPKGWSSPEVVLKADIFEASHTYRLRGLDQYLTIVEAQDRDSGRRYYKSFAADRLDGEWKPLTDSKQSPFAGAANCKDVGEHWTDSFSHGELIRTGYDEKMEVDPHRPRFLIQGVLDSEKKDKPYGQYPWRIGLLESF
jgi:hypothetical protein